MRIIAIRPMQIWIVETDEEEYPEYRRLHAENWEQRMGESWEPVYDCALLEKLWVKAQRP